METKFVKTRCLGSGPTIIFEYGTISLITTSIPHGIALLEGRRREEVAEPAELEINEFRTCLRTADPGLPWPKKGPENSLAEQGAEQPVAAPPVQGSRSHLPTNHCQYPEGPRKHPAGQAQGFPTEVAPSSPPLL